jgi:hypothetical protein
MKREEVEISYDGYCPLGSVCSKGGGKLCSKSSLDERKGFVMNHLMRSPYHGLETSMAEEVLLADTGRIEAWVRPVQYKVAYDFSEAGEMLSKTYLDDGIVVGTGVQHEPRKKRTVVAADVHTDDDPNPSRRGLAACSKYPPPTLDVPLPYTMPQRSSHVTISRIELDEMCDCFTRAEGSLSHAASMATKAAKAFEEEASAIRACRHHLERFRRG